MREFTPVFTERATNILSPAFTKKIPEISQMLKEIYQAHSVAILPGCGTFGLEAAARQFAQNKKCLVISNGFFGHRWEKILQQGRIAETIKILKAQNSRGFYQPPEIQIVLEKINEKQPEVVFLTHVETSTGIILPEDYLQAITQAVHENKGIVILDAIASGHVWLNMEQLNIDVLLTAPQKGLSAQAGCGIVLLNKKARELIEIETSTSLSLDLRQWLLVMEHYEKEGFYYHSTLPTDVLLSLHRSLLDITQQGIKKTKETQQKLGAAVRKMLEEKRLKSVAGEGYKAPSVLVYFVDNPAEVVQRFKEQQIHIVGGLPFMLENAEKPNTFRIGLLGIEKIKAKEEVIALFTEVLHKVFPV